MMKRARRAIAMFLAIFAFVLFCFGPMAQSVNAVAVIDDAIITILIAALAAVGITFVTTGAFQNTKSYVSGLFAEYAELNNMTSTEMAGGVEYARNGLGNILINNRFVLLVDGFTNYVKMKLGLVNNDNITLVSGGYYLGTIELCKLPVTYLRYENQTVEFVTYESDLPCYVMRAGDHPVFVSEWSCFVRCTNQYQGSDAIYQLLKNNGEINGNTLTNPQLFWSLHYNASFTFNGVNSGTIPPRYTGTEAVAAITSNSRITSQTGLIVRTGAINPPLDDGRYQNGYGGVIDVGAQWGESLGSIIGQTIPGEFSEGRVGDTSITYEDMDVIEEEIEEGGGSQVISDNPSDYAVQGLDTIFPFCIPFDLYNFVSCLDATPEAPVINYRFFVPGICDETIVIDLSVFDTAAQILRTMELLLFCVGLAFITRKIIRG